MAKKIKSKISHGVVHITAQFNNTLITITDAQGGTLASSSSGACGFKGSRKGTPFAAQVAAERAVKKVKDLFEMAIVKVRVKGPGSGRESAIRMLRSCELIVEEIVDVTPIPHNGCRPPKKRRV